MYPKLFLTILFATIIVNVPDGVVDEAADWFHWKEDCGETRAEYATRRIFEYATPIASFFRFKTPAEAGLTWEVKE